MLCWWVCPRLQEKVGGRHTRKRGSMKQGGINTAVSCGYWIVVPRIFRFHNTPPRYNLKPLYKTTSRDSGPVVASQKIRIDWKQKLNLKTNRNIFIKKNILTLVLWCSWLRQVIFCQCLWRPYMPTLFWVHFYIRGWNTTGFRIPSKGVRILTWDAYHVVAIQIVKVTYILIFFIFFLLFGMSHICHYCMPQSD